MMKEIAILKKCDSDYIVTYYGSYIKDTDLWVSCINYYERLVKNKLNEITGISYTDCHGVLWWWICNRFDELYRGDFQ